MLLVAVAALPVVVVDGDLLVFPALALVVGTWLVIAAIALARWMMVVGAPPIVALVRTAASGAWASISEDPLGRRLHRLADRVRGVVRPLRPVGRWLQTERLSLTRRLGAFAIRPNLRAT